MNIFYSIIKIAFGVFLFVPLLFQGCSSKTASYHYTRKQIEHGDLNFHEKIRVDEYINAFPQDEIVVPENQDIVLKVDPFSSYQPKEENRTLIQIALKTRMLNSEEKKAPVGLCFVLDVSGSMSADSKMADATSALMNAVVELQDGDELALVTFNNNAKTVIKPTVINPQTRIQITEVLKDLMSGGGTNIEAGLVLGYSELAEFKYSFHRRLILLTDGQSNVGITAPEEIARKAAVSYQEDARISTIGLGIDVNASLLRTIATNGTGHYYFAENGKALTAILREELQTTIIPIAQNVLVDISLEKGFRMLRIYGVENQIESNLIDIGELNVNDWRVLIAEIEGDVTPGSYIPMNAKVTFTPINDQGSQTLTANTEINWHIDKSMEASAVNTNVVRNSIAFGNAVCLVNIGELAEKGRYDKALRILDLQINNNKIFQQLDNSGSMIKELERLNQVRDILLKRLDGSDGVSRTSTHMAGNSMGKKEESDVSEKLSLKTMVLSGLSIAGDTMPGIWGTMAKLFVVMIR